MAQNKLLALCFLATGGVLYVQSTTKFRLFSFITFSKIGTDSERNGENNLNTLH